MKNLLSYIPAVILFLLLVLADYLGFGHLLHPKIWYIFLFFVFLDFFVFRISKMGIEKNNFINLHLGGVVTKMILILIFVGMFMYFFPENRKLFLINVLVFYLYFSIFEIWILVRNLRRF